MSIARNVLLLTLALGTAPAFAQQEVSKVLGGIDADAGQTYGDLNTVNGGIDIGAGAKTGDATTVNGGIDVADKARTGDLTTVNGGVELGRDVSVDGDITTVNGSIFVDRGGKVEGDVTNVNGGIGLVATEVGGGLQTVTGDITVGVDSHVKGGIRIEKNKGSIRFEPKRDPRIVIGPNAVVEGALVFERPVVLYVHRTAKIGRVTGATAKTFDTPTAPKD